MSTEIELQVDRLYKSYGDVVAVDGVSFDIRPSEWVALLGPSGCGKTTTLRCVAGLEEVTAGQIRLGDQFLAGPGIHVTPQRRDVNMVFQSYAIWPHMSVFRNVGYGLNVNGVSRAEIKRRVRAALEITQLEALETRSAAELSGGQQQRVAVARALVTEPRLLLFDEPLSNLDAKLRERMRFELSAIRGRMNRPALYVTHDQAEAMVVADRIVLMNEGGIVQTGTPQQLYEEPANRFAAEFIGVGNFYKGVIESFGPDGGARVEIPEFGVTVTLRVDGIPDVLRTVGGEVEVLVRPEHVVVATEPRDRADGWWTEGIPAIVESASYLGDHYACELKVGATQCRAKLQPNPRVTKGEKLSIQLDQRLLVALAVEPGGSSATVTDGLSAGAMPDGADHQEGRCLDA